MKRKKAKEGSRVPASRVRARARITSILVASMVMLISAAPAFAVNEPRLVATFPEDLAAARSIDAWKVSATYDRDINGFTSRLQVFDKNGIQVDGVVDLAGPQSNTGGKRTIRFTPIAPLDESLSPYDARARAFPLAPGEPTVSEWRFAIDDTPPAPPVITDPTAGQVRDDQPMRASGTTEPGAFIDIVEHTATIATQRATIDGDFVIELPYPPEDGVTHTIQAVATDRAGNRSAASASVTFVHDSVVLIPVIVTPSHGQHLNTGSVLVSGTAKAGSTVTVREGGAPVGSAPVNGAGEWATTIGFPAGTHVITAEAFDGTNTDGPSPARTFTVDLTPPPVPSIATPSPGAALASHGVTVSGSAEPNTSVRIREGSLLRATIPVDGAGAWSALVSFSEGPHTITATGVDRAGNVGAASASRSFTVDTAAPPPPVITMPAQGSFSSSATVTVAGSAEAFSTVRVTREGLLVAMATAAGTGSWSVMVSFADGTHVLRAVAVDDAGNVSPPSAARGFTVDTVAPAAPDITHPSPGDAFDRQQVLVVGTGEPGAVIEVLEGLSVVGSTVADGASNWSMSITFAPGAHTIEARATDLAGNVSPLSGSTSFTISTTIDVTPPPAPSIIEPTAGGVVNRDVLFRGTAEAGATVRVFEGATELGSATADGTGSWRFAAFLAPGGHTVVADATDQAGNTSGPSASRTFTVDGTRPTNTFTTPSGTIFLPGGPVVLAGEASDNTGVAAVGIEIYDRITGARVTTIAATCGSCPSSPAATASWQASPPLGPGSYRARAIAIDRAGNGSHPSEITFVVL